MKKDSSSSSSSSQGSEDTQEKTPVYVASFSLPVAVKEDPKTKKIEASARPGGLGIAVNAALPKDGPYELKRWVGINPNYKKEDGGVDTEKQERVNQAFLDGDTHNFKFAYVSEEVRDALYTKAANQLIYPMVLQLDDKIDPAATLAGYEAGNKALADELISTIKEDNNGEVPKDTMIWVHDYQILSVPKYIKEEAPEAKVGFFMHTPFPEIEPENLITTEQEYFKTALENVIQADNLQFHTEQFKQDFLKTLKNFEIVKTPEELQAVAAKVEVNPIGIPKEALQKMTNERFNEVMTDKVRQQDIVVSESPSRKKDKFVKTGTKGEDPMDDYVLVTKNFDQSPLHEAVEDKMKEWVKLKGPDDNKGTLKVDPKMINIGSVGRFDYTKGLQEQLKGFQMLLNMAKQKGIRHPEEHYRMHVVASPPRPIKEDQKYAAEAKEIMDEIMQQYPDSINLIPFVPNEELPIFNAAMDIHIAPSKSDGFLISAGEAFVSRNMAIEQGLLGKSLEPSALVLSTGAGMARSLEKEQVPAVSIIKPRATSVANALLKQSTEIQAQRGQLGPLQDTRGFDKIPSQVNSTQEYGLKALTAITPGAARKAASITKRPRRESQKQDRKESSKRQKVHA
ncbi:trehalose-6-phosphate synthase [Ascidiimonas sp. W6]|uniref:trehalose-6-phosphate synthase n=1 Tax=Ascidiimonas meishanensis TaxID=3128903 RepID=UPI0030ED21AF